MQLHGNARTSPYIRREIVRRVLEQAEPAKDTAAALGVSVRTIYKWLRRYRVRPGHRIHGDRSRTVEGAGWENAHVAVDDHSRVAYTEVLQAEDQHTCTAFLQRAVEFFAAHGVRIQQVMTDNGPGYISKRFNRLCDQLQIRHIYTRPHTPRTNGKAERFIRTLKEQWAYGACYQTSAHRTRALQPWTNRYNRYRPHAGIGMQTPMSRLQVSP